MDFGIWLVAFLLRILAGLFLLRFLLQLFRADYYNPFSQWILKVTNYLLEPTLRRLVPRLAGQDTASFLGVILALGLVAWLTLKQGGFLAWLLLTLIFLINLVVNVYLIILLALMIASFISMGGGYNPVLTVLSNLTDPFLNPIRKILPPLAGLDFSPLVFLIVLQIFAEVIVRLLLSIPVA
jgi:YggT family protein